MLRNAISKAPSSRGRWPALAILWTLGCSQASATNTRPALDETGDTGGGHSASPAVAQALPDPKDLRPIGGAAVCSATRECAVIGETNGAEWAFASPCEDGAGCNRCMAAHCCAQATACFAKVDGADNDCHQLFDCLATSCGSQNESCTNGCISSHPGPDGQAWRQAAELENCRNRYCTQCE